MIEGKWKNGLKQAYKNQCNIFTDLDPDGTWALHVVEYAAAHTFLYTACF